MPFDPFAPPNPPLFPDQWTALEAVAEQDEDGKRLTHIKMAKLIASRLEASAAYSVACTVLQELRIKDVLVANGGIYDTWSVTDTGRLLLSLRSEPVSS